jgi:predicted nucleic acid-binding protein
MGVDAVCICGPVMTEFLQGGRTAAELAKAEGIVREMRHLPVPQGTYRSAVGICRDAAKAEAGFPPKSTTDCIIAACAVRHRVPLLHRDQHFDALAEVSKLQLVPCP